VARARLGDDAFDASYRVGRGLPFDEIADLLHD
jgi:hypothetical protein